MLLYSVQRMQRFFLNRNHSVPVQTQKVAFDLNSNPIKVYLAVNYKVKIRLYNELGSLMN